MGGSYVNGATNCRLKTWLSTWENCVSLMSRRPCKTVSPMHTVRAIPRHVKYLRDSIDKSKVFKPGISRIVESLTWIVQLCEYQMMFLILLWTGYCLDRMTTSFGLSKAIFRPAGSYSFDPEGSVPQRG